VAEHATTGTVEVPGGTAAQPVAGGAHDNEHYSGRKISWIGTSIVCVGFLVGGIAFIPHPTWWLFWLGAGVTIVGCLILAFAKTMSEDWY
jgi:hypothetical protein